MNAKFSLAIIALVGIGVFALPSTMSLFAGQHSFYNIDATGNQVPCKKCHGDVQAELGANYVSDSSRGPHADMTCEYCHRIERGAASGDDAVWVVFYQNTTAPGLNRSMVISVIDYEAGNIPASILNNNNISEIQQVQRNLGFQTFVNANVSAPDPADSTNRKLTQVSRDGIELINLNPSGIPLDGNSDTMNSGFRASKVEPANWTADSSGKLQLNPYGLGSRTVNPGTQYHAASLVSCLECHGGKAPVGHETDRTIGPEGSVQCNDCHYGGGSIADGQGGQQMRNLWAGGFRNSAGVNLTGKATDNGSAEAHNAWVETPGASRFAKGQAKYGANNDACIACHTHVAIDINFKKAYKLEIDATAGTSTVGGKSGYTVSNAQVAGTVNISVYGNQEGDTFAVTNQAITWNSGVPMYINGQGTATVLDLNEEATDDATALLP